LRSEIGDFIGDGRNYSYDQADAQISVTSEGATLQIRVDGDENWIGLFVLPDSYSLLEPGTYDYMTEGPFNSHGSGGFFWQGEHRGCGASGLMVIDFVSYEGTELTSVSLSFEQRCDGAAAALHGEIHWNTNDTTSPPDPVMPPPAGLWEPAPGSTPGSGNYVYLESHPSDSIGAGLDFLHTPADALIEVGAFGNEFFITVEGDEGWRGSYQGRYNQTKLDVGYYGDLQRRLLHNPAKGGLSWFGDRGNCIEVSGWFVVDSITYDGEDLVQIELRFEQYCDDSNGALHGKIRWDANDTTGFPSPENPPPPGLWEPAPGVVPQDRNYVYLESVSGDYVGNGETYLYDQSVAILSTTADDASFVIGVRGDETWSGVIAGMYSQSQLEPGFYGEVQRSGRHNPAYGGLHWLGEGRTCVTVSGWFVIDDIAYNGASLKSIDLRFEQYCDGGASPLRGAIHWDVSDTTIPPGPEVPPPAGLWEPPPGATPAGGNYVFLASEPGEFVGQGGTYLHTQADSNLQVITSDGRLLLLVQGDEIWRGEFQAMDGLDQLGFGYYADLQRYPGHNPVKGGLNFRSETHTCDTVSGWFAVDSVTYEGDTLSTIDLRFGQFCNGDSAALNGELHWDINDMTGPPGPVSPPAGLWEPSPDATPSSGIYVYLESEPGDYIGEGQTYLYAEGDGRFTVESADAHLHVEFAGNENWTGDFEGMDFLDRLEVGYYGDLKRWPFHNPVKGGLNWIEFFRGCAAQSGWFVVDSVAYEDAVLTAIDLRFEQHCNDDPAALYGEIHWDIYDTTIPPGPTNPPPSGLWEPAPGTTPENGNFIYLESQAGDYIGQGETYLYTGADAQIDVSDVAGWLDFAVFGSEVWHGEFSGPDRLDQLEVGFYGNLRRYWDHDPLWGGMYWNINGRGCSEIGGWFVVDSVTYDGLGLADVELRFEQHCGDAVPALFGEIRWSR
jgi:hypothetical protein